MLVTEFIWWNDRNKKKCFLPNKKKWKTLLGISYLTIYNNTCGFKNNLKKSKLLKVEQYFQNSFKGSFRIHGVVGKSWVVSYFVFYNFYCIFMTKFFELFWGNLRGYPLAPPPLLPGPLSPLCATMKFLAIVTEL